MAKMLSSISSKVFAGYAAVLVITLISAFSLTGTTRNVENEVHTFVDQTLPQLGELGKIGDQVSQMEIAAYSLYGTTLNTADYDARLSTVRRNRDVSLNALKSSDSQVRLDGLQRQLKALDTSLQSLRRVMAANSVDWDAARNELSRLSSASASAHSELNTLNANVGKMANETSMRIIDDMATTVQRVILLVSGILIVALLGYIFARRQVANPIADLASRLNRVAEEKNLTLQLPQRSQDEVGLASGSVNDLLELFRSGMAEVSTATRSISDSVGALSNTASSSDAAINNLNQQIDQLMLTMHQLEDQIEQGVERTARASESARRGADEVQLGATEVTRTSESIEALSVDIEHTAKSLHELRDAGDQVSSVVSTIAEIADQTNLLALNAAIEAARAGESGRGFAVVADEVRTLATRTHQSTVEINNMLEAIVSSITTSMNTMASNQEKARNSVELARSTVDSLSAIRETIQHLSGECDDAASFASHARDEMGTVRNKVQQFKSLGDTVVDGSRDTQHASSSLNQLARNLETMTSRFKV